MLIALHQFRGGRYDRQKYALRRCGLRRVMYLVEGTPEAEVQGVRAQLLLLLLIIQGFLS